MYFLSNDENIIKSIKSKSSHINRVRTVLGSVSICLQWQVEQRFPKIPMMYLCRQPQSGNRLMRSKLVQFNHPNIINILYVVMCWKTAPHGSWTGLRWQPNVPRELGVAVFVGQNCGHLHLWLCMTTVYINKDAI